MLGVGLTLLAHSVPHQDPSGAGSQGERLTGRRSSDNAPYRAWPLASRYTSDDRVRGVEGLLGGRVRVRVDYGEPRWSFGLKH